MRLNRPGEVLPIEHPKVILAEGADAGWFFIWAVEAWGLKDIQVIDFGGVDGHLRPLLRGLRGPTSGSSQITALVVARDAETSASGAWQSVTDALRNAGFAVPSRPFEFAAGSPRTAAIIFPGFESPDGVANLSDGTLEDLCLATVGDDSLLACIEEFMACAQDAGEPLTHSKKARLHAYLAGKDDYAGLKLGEAARAGAWDWDHPALVRVRGLLQDR